MLTIILLHHGGSFHHPLHPLPLRTILHQPIQPRPLRHRTHHLHIIIPHLDKDALLLQVWLSQWSGESLGGGEG